MSVESEKIREWRQNWPLPFVSMLGVAGSGVYTYSNGVFMNEMIDEFGWTRTQYTSGMMSSLIVILAIVPLLGRLVDRFGPRKVALTVIIPAALGPSFLGLANGDVWQWWLLTFLQAIPVMFIVPTLWLKAVVGQFHASRGLALAVVLAGTGLGTGLFPLMAGFFIEWFGWRFAWGAVGVCWGLVMMPLAYFFFFDTGKREATPQVRAKVPPYGHILKSRTFICLAAGGVMFVWASAALGVHLVPILQAKGHGLTTAASLAGLLGVCAVAGRIGVGYLLDIVRTRPFAIVVFLLPMAVCLLLFYAQTFVVAVAAVMLLGFAVGAESDIITYIASRRIPHAVFSSVYAVFQTITAVASITAATGASMLYDWWGSYALMLVVMPALAVVSSVLIGLIPEAGHNDVDEVPPGPDQEEVPTAVKAAGWG